MKIFIRISITVLFLLFMATLFMAAFCNIAYAKSHTYSPKEKDVIARVVYAEARNQPFLGKAGVALTIIYRFESGKYGKTINRVTRYGQYCKASKATVNKKRNRKAYLKCLEAVEWAIKNRVLPSNTFYFQRAHRKTWGRRNLIKIYCRIGAHSFYTRGKAKPVKGDLYIDRNGKLRTK